MTNDQSTQPIQQILIVIKRLFNGDYGLFKSFWYFLLPVVLMISLSKDQLLKTDERFFIVFMLLVNTYLFIAIIGTWRATFKYKDNTAGLYKLITFLCLSYFSIKWMSSVFLIVILAFTRFSNS